MDHIFPRRYSVHTIAVPIVEETIVQTNSSVTLVNSPFYESQGPYSRTSYDYIAGFGLVEVAISTSPKPTIYRKFCENMGPGAQRSSMFNVVNSPLTSQCLITIAIRHWEVKGELYRYIDDKGEISLKVIEDNKVDHQGPSNSTSQLLYYLNVLLFCIRNVSINLNFSYGKENFSLPTLVRPCGWDNNGMTIITRDLLLHTTCVMKGCNLLYNENKMFLIKWVLGHLCAHIG